MLQLFEGYLEAKNVADEESYDRVREGVVVFLGTLAQHLDPAEKKVLLFPILHLQVQSCIRACWPMPHLVKLQDLLAQGNDAFK